MTDKELIDLVKKTAVNDAINSEDDFLELEDKDELYDIADDAWWQSGLIVLQEDYEIDDEKIEELELNELYNQTFVDAIIKKHNLKFD